MKLSIVHQTRYEYSDPVTSAHHLAYLAPRDEARQRCLQHEVEIEPQPRALRERFDAFGNRSLYFGLHEPHRRLHIVARSLVESRLPPDLDPAASPPWDTVAEQLRQARRRDLLDACELTFESPHVRIDPAASGYAAPSFPPGRPLLQAAVELMQRIHADFTYDPSATDVSTPVDQVLEVRRGVCQDFAHVLLACLRGQGLAARYVSGYLLTRPPPGKPKLIGADASHAWVSVFVPDQGWFDLDPTNAIMPAGEHVTVALGRDFADVTPVRGVILGGGRHEVHVSVDVSRVGE